MISKCTPLDCRVEGIETAPANNLFVSRSSSSVDAKPADPNSKYFRVSTATKTNPRFSCDAAMIAVAALSLSSVRHCDVYLVSLHAPNRISTAAWIQCEFSVHFYRLRFCIAFGEMSCNCWWTKHSRQWHPGVVVDVVRINSAKRTILFRIFYEYFVCDYL